MADEIMNEFEEETEEPLEEVEEVQADSAHTDMLELTEEELDHVADTAIDALQGILKFFDVVSTKRGGVDAYTCYGVSNHYVVIADDCLIAR
jgi:hypothetical protein